jgi:sugar/nucleoside kinase (ribokinase family)
LGELGVRLDAFRVVRSRVTPTYAKPMIRGYESEQEDPRLDFQDDRDLDAAEEGGLLASLRLLAADVDGVVCIDQIEDDHGGIVTRGVREALAAIGAARARLPILADSRGRIGHFTNVCVKANRLEIAHALGRDQPPATVADLLACGTALSRRTGRVVFVSAGSQGMGCADGERVEHVPAVPITGPTDPVGAGDAASAGLVSALAAGASLGEAMAFANAVAAVTVRKLGVTGTASPAEVLEVLG